MTADALISDIGIVDPCCKVPYGPDIPVRPGTGGTEATVSRVVGRLRREFSFALFQKPEVCSSARAGITHLPLDQAFRPNAARAFLVINSWKVACRLRRAHPGSRINLWLHVYPGRHNRGMGRALVKAGIDVICVSRSHAIAFARFLAPQERPQILHIYNPVADALMPDATPRDPRRLLYASSPHKGLREVFARFRELRLHQPDLQLRVADPGYLSWDTGPVPAGVRFLGTLSHARLMKEMRRALCLFAPQTSFPETFGLVFTEANAVGTPVLAHKALGANDEILDAGQTLDAGDPQAIAARIGEWQRALPTVRLAENYRLAEVAQVWQSQFTEMLAEHRLQFLRAAE